MVNADTAVALIPTPVARPACIVCGEPVTRPTYLRYCSSKCRVKGQGQPAQGSKSCVRCGKPVFRQKMTSIYCSRECGQKASKSAERKRQVAEIKTCQLCGMPFQRAWSARYCSSVCCQKFHKINPRRKECNMDPYIVTKEEQHAGNQVCNADLDKAVPKFFRGEISVDAAASLVHDILLAAGQARIVADATAKAAADAKKP